MGGGVVEEDEVIRSMFGFSLLLKSAPGAGGVALDARTP